MAKMPDIEIALRISAEVSAERGGALPKITTPDGWTVELLPQRSRVPGGEPAVERDGSRRYLALSDELDQALRMRGITGHIGLRFTPHHSSPRRWLLDFADGYTPGWPPAQIRAKADIAERDARIDRLEAEVKGLREALAIRKEMHEEHKAELRAARDEIAALRAHSDRLAAELERLPQMVIVSSRFGDQPTPGEKP